MTIIFLFKHSEINIISNNLPPPHLNYFFTSWQIMLALVQNLDFTWNCRQLVLGIFHTFGKNLHNLSKEQKQHIEAVISNQSCQILFWQVRLECFLGLFSFRRHVGSDARWTVSRLLTIFCRQHWIQKIPTMQSFNIYPINLSWVSLPWLYSQTASRQA